jgi:Trypsin-like peptidase domain
MLLAFILSLAVLGQQAPASSTIPEDFNTILMRSTFKIEGKGSSGTAFILGKPMQTDPKRGHFVLITAAHVLAQMQGEDAVLVLRKKHAESFTKMPLTIRIRNNGRPVWVAHPAADIGVMYVDLPDETDIALISTDLLANDETLRKFEVHSGDRLSCLGYPLGIESSEAGFPVLRSGYVASFPILPTASVKSFLFDFNVFEGNSGGPVYLSESNRYYGGSLQVGSVNLLVGLVSEQRVADEQIKSLSELRVQRHRLGLAVVIQAALIRQVLDLLPPKA